MHVQVLNGIAETARMQAFFINQTKTHSLVSKCHINLEKSDAMEMKKLLRINSFP